MLTFFPTPYPNELWYSVLCRYHIRSGNAKYAATANELGFGHILNISVWNAGKELRTILNILPSYSISAQNVCQSHTLIPYQSRFSSVHKKQAVLDYINGRSTSSANPLTNITQWVSPQLFLRYCPMCCVEDEKQYGELYWHREHQIQAMSVCPKHHCYLSNSFVEITSSLRQKFIPASRANCPDIKPIIAEDNMLCAFNNGLYSLLVSPMRVEEDERSKVGMALKGALMDRGFLSPTSGYLDMPAIQAQLKQMDFWVYDATAISDISITRIINTHQFTMPEEYAVLMTLCGIPYHQCLTHDGRFIQDDIAKRMIAIKGNKPIVKKGDIAKALSVPVYAVGKLARERGIEPFWTTTSKGKRTGKKQVAIKVYVNEEEKAAIMQAAKNLGVGASAYIRSCILKKL